jgi:hypothetical protein
MFQSLDEAEAVKADLLQRHSATLRRTIGEVFDEWLAWCVDSRGIKPATVYCYVQISRRLPLAMQLGRMTESEARKLYQTQVDWVSPRGPRGPHPSRRTTCFCASSRICGAGPSSGATVTRIRGARSRLWDDDRRGGSSFGLTRRDGSKRWRSSLRGGVTSRPSSRC